MEVEGQDTGETQENEHAMSQHEGQAFRPYPARKASKPRSIMRPSGPGGRRGPGARKWAQSIGVVVTDTTSEIRIATDSVTANSRNSRPTIPPISRIGMNTAIRDRLIDSTVNPTSCAPRKAASMRVIPASM